MPFGDGGEGREGFLWVFGGGAWAVGFAVSKSNSSVNE